MTVSFHSVASEDGVNLKFIDSTYRDTMALLIEARNYVAYRQAIEDRSHAPLDRLSISHETLRVTARLTQAMAWLLAQKAVQNGEIDSNELVFGRYALSGMEVCLDESAAESQALPNGLRSLLDRSASLYRRVVRLERMIRDYRAPRKSGKAKAPKPFTPVVIANDDHVSEAVAAMLTGTQIAGKAGSGKGRSRKKSDGKDDGIETQKGSDDALPLSEE